MTLKHDLANAYTDRRFERPRIVGIGASAGGLVALEQFFQHTPSDSGLAWIVIQHLDPTKSSLLPELLQRTTSMPVLEATQGMRIKRDHVYVIPPNTELGVEKSKLTLSKPAEVRGLRLPVNVLFSSLASDCGEQAIAVVLSGMGSDGTAGALAIKAAGGLTMVQTPDSAQFDSMPNSIITSGCADIIAAAADLPARILAFVQQTKQRNLSPDTDIKDHSAIAPSAPLQQIILHLQHHTRHDFSLYKSSTLLRRIERRMAIHALASLELYSAFLANNTQEIDLLFKELLIGVTSFFRDDEVWNYLSGTTLPDLLAHNVEQSVLRAWSVGCSTGEEAYSLAMIFREVIDRLPAYKNHSLQIFASDLSADAIASARRAQYPLNIEDQISPTRLARFFTQHKNYYQINQEIRDMVLFAQHDVVLNPPFTRLDLIVCRNLLIYFDAELQRRLLPLFHYSLRAHGILLLGSSETVGRLQHLFLPIQAKLRLYQRRHDVASPARSLPLQSFPPLSTLVKEHPMSNINPVSGAADNLQSAADHLLLQIYSPAAVVINADADIVYISGRTGKYLEPAAGKANWNFHAMVKDGLRLPISAALKQAALKKTTIQLRRLSISTEDHTQLVDVTIQPLQEPATLLGMTMIVFRGAADGVPAITSTLEKSKSNATGVDSETETLDAAAVEFGYKAIQLQYQDEIQALREETHNSREQLQSTNEELQSTNEELQSTNEELTTSKEEMQSMNEELQTINTELQTKLDDLALAQSDLQNTLNSIEIAILFLDQNLNVRRYTDRAAKIINLRESDLGRPLSDLTSTLQYPSLHEDALTTLNTLVFSEKEIETNDGRWFSVRIMPYRRLDNMIDGVVITLFDISTTKKLEAALRGQ